MIQTKSSPIAYTGMPLSQPPKSGAMIQTQNVSFRFLDWNALSQPPKSGAMIQTKADVTFSCSEVESQPPKSGAMIQTWHLL